MKQLAAIFLIALFAFNLFGYRVLFYFVQQHSDLIVEKAIDNNQYNEGDLMEIKIPLSMPYQTNQANFERFDGEVNFNGKIYKYVKRKISDGNLVLLCIPSNNKMRLETAKNEFFKNAADLQNAASKKSDNGKAGFAKNISSDYNHHTTDFKISYFSTLNKQVYSNRVSPLASALDSSPEQPPEFI